MKIFNVRAQVLDIFEHTDISHVLSIYCAPFPSPLLSSCLLSRSYTFRSFHVYMLTLRSMSLTAAAALLAVVAPLLLLLLLLPC